VVAPSAAVARFLSRQRALARDVAVIAAVVALNAAGTTSAGIGCARTVTSQVSDSAAVVAIATAPAASAAGEATSSAGSGACACDVTGLSALVALATSLAVRGASSGRVVRAVTREVTSLLAAEACLGSGLVDAGGAHVALLTAVVAGGVAGRRAGGGDVPEVTAVVASTTDHV